MKPKIKKSNPVAKYANAFNKAKTHRDKKKDYSRKGKAWKLSDPLNR
jgi:hypothetical protein